jgi:hypothetical protein
MHLKNGKFSKIQGPNSKKIKYEHSICTDCNNTLSQPFDRSYDQFFDYIQNNPSSVFKNRFIDFYEVYGERGL